MLNYVWIGLVIIGVLTAAGNDIYDSASNRYHNGAEFELKYDTTAGGRIAFSKDYYEKFYGINVESRDTLMFPATLKAKSIQIKLDESAPQLWKTIAKTAGDEKQITAQITGKNGSGLLILLPSTSLVKTKAVLDAVISYSGTAVEIAVGLIGVMAFWLGIMKLGEDSGLIKIIARLMRPVMTRLFPDIPPDHPAIAAMIMNIAANVLGLNNAATPLGLKAMDELDKLNPRKGTATDAMVTFLAINTAGLTIIPATAIAVRAALGSKEPTVILMTSFFGAGLATIAGVVAAKILQRLKVYRFDGTSGPAASKEETN
ncbi:MAG TPA: nucleoside recognition domain-containing protein [Candidatus Acidoferrales bacterium]|nr:nucleoside recognition domain-containing protein [Candidatus Acidoferrales bacterium]